MGDKASTAATLEDCRAECIDNDECTGVDWVAAQTTGHQCWLVGPVTKKTTAQSGTDRHTLNRTCLTGGIVIQWYVAPYTDNTEWYVALMLAAGVWGGVGGA